MNPITLALLGLAVMLILMLLNYPVSLAMLTVGFVGIAIFASPAAAFNALSTNIWGQFASYGFSVIPLFIFMGQIAYRSGITEKLYDSAYRWVGSLPGGLAGTTILASMFFSAICGSNSATSATMGTIALPEMKKRHYDYTLSTGSVAVGGTLGTVIPPSLAVIIVALQTQQSILRIFLAIAAPGIFLTSLLLLTVLIVCLRNPLLGPVGPKTTFKEKITALSGIIEALILFALVIGGLYLGWFTPSEAGAAGAFGALIIAILQNKLPMEKFKLAAIDTVKTSCMVLLLITGAVILTRFLSLTRLPYVLAELVVDLAVPPFFILLMILLIYVVGGCIMDGLGFLVASIPIFFPVALALGYDPIHFLVLIIFVTTMGAITPPVGINVYVVSGLVPDIPIQTIFKGTSIFLPAYIICIIILIIYPQAVLYLPGLAM